MNQDEKFIALFLEDDLQFYDKYLSELTIEELQKFLEENPTFMTEEQKRFRQFAANKKLWKTFHSLVERSLD